MLKLKTQPFNLTKKIQCKFHFDIDVSTTISTAKMTRPNDIIRIQKKKLMMSH